MHGRKIIEAETLSEGREKFNISVFAVWDFYKMMVRLFRILINYLNSLTFKVSQRRSVVQSETTVFNNGFIFIRILRCDVTINFKLRK